METESNSSVKPSLNLLPWLAIAGALGLFLFTMSHWVTLESLPVVAQITGWDWHPYPLDWRAYPIKPLWMLVSCPLRVFPVGWQPVVLNVFSVICAALTLGTLIKSVQLLPHDRTRDQRQRLPEDNPFLSVRHAFLPALFAALMLGLQRTFWEHATAATGESFDLLVFAVLIFCLLQFRASRNEKWLSGFALLYGLGVVNNWALIGFFPFFLVAFVWIKGLEIFNWRFLSRTAGWGMAGLLFYLAYPVAVWLTPGDGDFWPLLHGEFALQAVMLRHMPRWLAAVAGAPLLFAFLFMSIRWPDSEGDISAQGSLLTKFFFRIMHLVFLGLVLLVFFEFKYSLGPRSLRAPTSFLTFYYLAALCVGYFAGYVLLVFGETPPVRWGRPDKFSKSIGTAMTCLLWITAVSAPGFLAWINLPKILAKNDDSLHRFADDLERSLPSKPEMVLCDDHLEYLLLAAIEGEPKPDGKVLVETSSFNHREYLLYLRRSYPRMQRYVPDAKHIAETVDVQPLVDLLSRFGKEAPVYYAHPSYGPFFEEFYLQPEGLVSRLRTHAADDLQPPLADAAEIKFNQDYWDRMEDHLLKNVAVKARIGTDASVAAGFYSRALDFWGVELQRAKMPAEAATRFNQALELNTNNVSAKINLLFNARLQKGGTQPVDLNEFRSQYMSVYMDWGQALMHDGPIDEPGFDLQFGEVLAQEGNLRQAAGCFERHLQFRPDDNDSRLALAKTFVDMGRCDRAFDELRKVRAHPVRDSLQLAWIEASAHLKRNDFAAAESLLVACRKEKPDDMGRLDAMIDFYRSTAYEALQKAQSETATPKARRQAVEDAPKRFASALTLLREKQRVLSQPGRDAPASELADIFVREAEMQMMLNHYPDAIGSLTQALRQEPSNESALLNRAISELQINKLDAARDDYTVLLDLAPKNYLYMVYYGLGTVGEQTHDNADAIKYYKHYLKLAPANTGEYLKVKQKLKILEGA